VHRVGPVAVDASSSTYVLPRRLRRWPIGVGVAGIEGHRHELSNIPIERESVDIPKFEKTPEQSDGTYLDILFRLLWRRNSNRGELERHESHSKNTLGCHADAAKARPCQQFLLCWHHQENDVDASVENARTSALAGMFRRHADVIVSVLLPPHGRTLPRFRGTLVDSLGTSGSLTAAVPGAAAQKVW
jgi:hypothetical protein